MFKSLEEMAKKLTEKKREKLFIEIQEKAIAWAIFFGGTCWGISLLWT